MIPSIATVAMFHSLFGTTVSYRIVPNLATIRYDTLGTTPNLRQNRGRSSSQMKELTIWDIAKNAKQPGRSQVQQEARELSDSLSKLLGRRYKSEEWGSLFSSLLSDVTDVHIQMLNYAEDTIDNEAAESFLSTVEASFCKVLSVRIVAKGGQELKIPWDKFEVDKHLSDSDETIVVSGIHRTSDGFFMPMNIAVAAGKEVDFNKMRILKIADCAWEGDYAKVLHKIRNMVRQPLKSQLSGFVNSYIGPYRWLLNQLYLLQQHPDLVDSEEYMEKLGLEEDVDIGNVYEAAEENIQRRAKSIVIMLKNRMAENFHEYELASIFLDAVEGADLPTDTAMFT